MGRISAQQVRVFGLFAVAYVLIGLGYAYQAMGNSALALATAAMAFAFICSMIIEAQRS